MTHAGASLGATSSVGRRPSARGDEELEEDGLRRELPGRRDPCESHQRRPPEAPQRAAEVPELSDAAAVLPELGVYRLDVWPNYLGWSRISIPEAAAMELETTVAISPETPDAAA